MSLSTVPQVPVARTQYDLRCVVAGALKELPIAPAIAVEDAAECLYVATSKESLTTYHCCEVTLPVVATESGVDPLSAAGVEAGWVATPTAEMFSSLFGVPVTLTPCELGYRYVSSVSASRRSDPLAASKADLTCAGVKEGLF
jgi:hypothetical protein